MALLKVKSNKTAGGRNPTRIAVETGDTDLDW
jgi:hypothetical protein